MEMTLAKYAGVRAGNYCSNPIIDVEVLPDVHHCVGCDEVITFHMGRHWQTSVWLHPAGADEGHTAVPRLRCSYCHCEDPELVLFRQEAWADVTVCQRCGGRDGFAIGD